MLDSGNMPIVRADQRVEHNGCVAARSGDDAPPPAPLRPPEVARFQHSESTCAIGLLCPSHQHA